MPNKTVLIIDDDPAIRETFGEIISLEGLEPEYAENGAVAIAKLQGGLRPALILLDLMMPVKDGFEFRQEQLSDPKLAQIPVIVLSAIGNMRDATSKLDPGISILRKPPELEELLGLITQKLR